MKEIMTIGKLAEATNISVETVRYYERKGLIKQPKKQGAYRYYSNDYITRIQFIKRSQEMGFTLKETGELLELNTQGNTEFSDVLLKAKDKICEIEKKIEELNLMKESLITLSRRCENADSEISECPVLDYFMFKGKQV